MFGLEVDWQKVFALGVVLLSFVFVVRGAMKWLLVGRKG